VWIKHFPKLIFLLLFICLFSIQHGIAGAADGDDVCFKMAAESLRHGDHADAIRQYQKIIRASSNDQNVAKAYLFAASIYAERLDQQEVAQKYFQHIIKHLAHTAVAPDAMINWGVLLYDTGHFGSAYQLFKSFLNQYPEHPRCRTAKWKYELAAKKLNIKTDSGFPNYHMPIAASAMKILINQGASDVVLRADESMWVSDRSGKILYDDVRRVTIHIADQQFIALNGQATGLTNCRVETVAKPIFVDGRRYRGSIEIVVHGQSLWIINHLPLEEYLYGVLPEEMPTDWPAEALKAQAVAARTYALYLKGQSKQALYDLKASTVSQVYRGVVAEKASSNKAIDDTRGEILTYEQRPIIAYFHSNSGGHTEDAKNVWGINIPYLVGIPDPDSLKPMNQNWHYTVSFDEMQRRLNPLIPSSQRITRIEPQHKSPSGRLRSLLLHTSRKKYSINSNAFRIRLGEQKIKSTLFDIYADDIAVVLKGRGYGHGVGMSQWGARYMAIAGKSYKDILQRYYKDVEIRKVAELAKNRFSP
jgi:stage II sporulation protein D